MASPLTRSARRSEGPKQRPNGAVHQNKSNNNHERPTESNINRRKRSRDSFDTEPDISSKKARIAIEIELRRKTEVRKSSLTALRSNANPSVPSLRSATTLSNAAQARLPTKQPAKHAEKVVNAIKHDLNALQLAAADKRDEKRKLRSGEGTRFKSELSAYFPDYDIVIGNEPEEKHFLNIETPIIVIDSKPLIKVEPLNFPKSRKPNGRPPKLRVRSFGDAAFKDLYQAQVVDFRFLNKHANGSAIRDPLPDSYYTPHHIKAGRLERTIRNFEKGHAQHEKDQVARLLDALQGHEWLKVMGVSGITEGKKKEYEPARDYFKTGCQQILEKFKTWREEEKRRKLEKDRAVAEAAQDEEEEEEEEEQEEEQEDEGAESDGDPPDYSDVDHAAARQLHEEAIARSAPLASSKAAEKRLKVEKMQPSAEDLERDFKSFYKKPHLRQAALGQRRSGRSASAWGQPLPEVSEQDFNLPEEYRDRETLKANARRKRRDRRESKD